MLDSVCIIPARGGSGRIPRKNIKDFFGKPIIAYSIDLAKNSSLFDKVYVSTEDKEIAKIATEYGADVIPRSNAMAHNDVTTQAVIRDAIRHLEEAAIFSPALLPTDETLVCCLYATSPLLSLQDLRRGRQLLYSNRKMCFSFSTGTPLHDAGNFYFGYGRSWKSEIPIHGPWSIMCPVENFQDINTPEDWALAEYKYAKLNGINYPIPKDSQAQVVAADPNL